MSDLSTPVVILLCICSLFPTNTHKFLTSQAGRKAGILQGWYQENRKGTEDAVYAYRVLFTRHMFFLALPAFCKMSCKGHSKLSKMWK